VEDLLGPAGPPIKQISPGDVPNSRRGRRGVKRQKELIDWFFDDWIDGNSISRDPPIYMEGVVLS
jgi:hypothetical protein